MNLEQAQDWVAALSGCFPDLKTTAVSAALAKLGALAPSGSWEAGVSAAGFERVDLRFSGAKDYAPWLAGAARLMNSAAPPDFTRAPESSPWLETRWDLRADALESCALYGRARAGVDAGAILQAGGGSARTSRRAGRFNARDFPDASVARALAEFAALAPVASRISEGERRWSLRLARRLPWPAFQRCDISAGFTSRSAQLALLTPAHFVRELAFEGESLWAYFEG
jgi:hypothetical protein